MIETRNILNRRTRGVKVDWKKALEESKDSGYVYSSGDEEDDYRVEDEDLEGDGDPSSEGEKIESSGSGSDMEE